jgi:DNA-binding NarL/FixJ family response regulator
VLLIAIARVVQAEAHTAEVTPGLIERGVELERSLGLRLEYFDSPLHWQARHLMRFGELDRARAILDELDGNAAAHGDESSRLPVRWWLGMLEWLGGRWDDAREHARAAAELGAETQHLHHRTYLARVKGQIEADLGLVDEARASIEAALSFTRTVSRYDTLVAIGVLGHLELAFGNLEAAGEHLRDLPARLFEGGADEPTSPILPDAIETLVGLGELELAGSYLEAYEASAAKLGSPVATAGAARCRGLLAAATGDRSAAFRAFQRSLDEYPFPFERARTLLCLGVVRRQAQQKRSGREALEQALAIFEELGARPWAEKARAELRRIGGRAAAPTGLTETETRVAELAAQGRSNKQIAAELYMGLSTVEKHLSRTYSKLGIRSRSGLGRRLASKKRENAAQP